MNSIDELKSRYGPVKFEVLEQKNLERISCVRRSLDHLVLAYSRVIFKAEGIRSFKPFHQRILDGEPIGDTVRDSEIEYTRVVSPFEDIHIGAHLVSIFGTKKNTSRHRTINYKIKGHPYAEITEWYNPDVT